MKILIIEDDPVKAGLVKDCIGDYVGDSASLSCTSSDNLSEAVRYIAQDKSDLIVLDLMLPYVKDGETSRTAGLELLRHIRQLEGPNYSTTVVGLYAYPDELAQSREEFDRLGILLVEYEEAGKWKETLQRILTDVQGSPGRVAMDFLVFVALEEEKVGYDFTDVQRLAVRPVAGLNVTTVRLEGPRVLHGAIVRLRQIGLVASVYEVSTALAAFDTRVVCMSGICAGFTARTELGQLVVASPAWEYQAGKWSKSGFEISPTQIPLRPDTKVAIDQFLSNEIILDDVERTLPREHRRPSSRSLPILGPAASGSAVIADKSRLAHIEQQHREIAVLDMETFGVYYAAHESPNYINHFFSMKCVVDMADEAKSDDLHAYGCIVSARATIQLLRYLLA